MHKGLNKIISLLILVMFLLVNTCLAAGTLRVPMGIGKRGIDLILLQAGSKQLVENQNEIAKASKVYAEIHGPENEAKGLELSIKRLGVGRIDKLLADSILLSKDGDKELVLKLLAFGKGSTFRFWEELKGEQKKRLLDQLESLDIEKAEKIHKRHIVDGVNDVDVEIADETIQAPKTFDLTEDNEENSNAANIGDTVFQNGEAGVIELVGGSGTRLKFPHPKALFKASQVTGKTLAQMRAEKIRALAEKNGKPVPWLLMTSDITHDEVVEFFNNNIQNGKYFNQVPVEWVKFKRQMVFPNMTNNGEFVVKATKDEIMVGGFGHGDARDYILRDPEVLDWLNKFGTKYITLLQVDNAYMVNSKALGHHIQATKNAQPGVEKLSMISVEKSYPGERVGMLNQFPSGLGVLEYNQFPPHLEYKKYIYKFNDESVVIIQDEDKYIVLTETELKEQYNPIQIPIMAFPMAYMTKKKFIGINEIPDGNIDITFLNGKITKTDLQEHAHLWLKLANLNQQIWSVDCLADTKHPLSDLPTVVAKGKEIKGFDPETEEYSDKVKVNKFERMDFHGFMVNKVDGVCILVDRSGVKSEEGGFAPLKNAEGNDSPVTVKAIYNEHDSQAFKNLGWTVSGKATIETTPALAYLDGSWLSEAVGKNGEMGDNVKLYLSGYRENVSIGENFNLKTGGSFILDAQDEYNPEMLVRIGNNVTKSKNVNVKFTVEGSGKLIIEDGAMLAKDKEYTVKDGEVLYVNSRGEDTLVESGEFSLKDLKNSKNFNL